MACNNLEYDTMYTSMDDQDRNINLNDNDDVFPLEDELHDDDIDFPVDDVVLEGEEQNLNDVIDSGLFLAAEQGYFSEPALRADLVLWITGATSVHDHMLEDASFDYGSVFASDDQGELNRVIGQSFSESAAGAFGSVPAAKSVLEALEKFRYERSNESDLMTCVICMEVVMNGTHLTRLPCSHVFHVDCIMEWLNDNHTCPLCRFKLPSQ
ncbi:E3 ubiquitin-protein ligase RING1-like protein [Morus notabilis]|uniref:RING-type E3 ubiquitin transferase n=1 Tax=Morus notabilis TaxID=981085 RepID=W9QY83_9ROSA|nr:E3 ubiquitin-protein ligase CIP8 [Morus notabilis]EXB44305.1 E3 ubiquitin-protein ligase RING1-like protein [Morus notabilis]